MGQQGRFRVAVPLAAQSTPLSQAAQLRVASNQFWNQVSNHIGQAARHQAQARVSPMVEIRTSDPQGSTPADQVTGGGVPGIEPPQSNSDIVRRHQQQ